MTGSHNSEDISHEVSGLAVELIEFSQSLFLSPHQQQALMTIVRVNDPDTKQRWITQNLRRVVNIAKRYSDHGVALMDLIREGIQGLVYAVESFEREGGFRFESYAVQCVRRNIERVIMNRKNPLSFNP